MTHERIPQESESVAGRPLFIAVVLTVIAGVIALLLEVVMLKSAGYSRRTARDARVPGENVGLIETSLFKSGEQGIRDRVSAEKLLQRAEWIDRSRGVARIPIDLAIDWVVEQPSSVEAGRPGPKASFRQRKGAR
jgi:hypothetical protein